MSVSPLEPKSSAYTSSATFACLESASHDGRVSGKSRVRLLVAPLCSVSIRLRCVSSFAAAACKSRSLTILYRSKTGRVFQPSIASIAFRVNRPPRFDPATERFDDKEANRYPRHENRQPFVAPEKVRASRPTGPGFGRDGADAAAAGVGGIV